MRVFSLERRHSAFRLLGALALCLAALAGPVRAEIVVASVWTLQSSLNRQALDLAIEKINAGGGLLGQTVRLVSFDEGCNDEQGALVARMVLRQSPSLVVGHQCSGPAITAAPTYAAAGVVQIAPNATSPRLTEMGIATVFRLVGRDDRQGAAAADRIAREWPKARIGLIEDDSVYGTALAASVRRELDRVGIDAVDSFPIRVRSRRSAEILAAVRRDNLNLVYFACNYSQDIGMLVRGLAAIPGLTILAGDAAIDLGDSVSRYLVDIPFYYTFFPDLSASPKVRALFAEGQARGVAFTDRTLRAYVAIELWAEAVRRAGSLDAARVAEVLHRDRFDTELGEVSFDAKGDVRGAPAEWAWRRLGVPAPRHVSEAAEDAAKGD